MQYFSKVLKLYHHSNWTSSSLALPQITINAFSSLSFTLGKWSIVFRNKRPSGWITLLRKPKRLNDRNKQSSYILEESFFIDAIIPSSHYLQDALFIRKKKIYLMPRGDANEASNMNYYDFFRVAIFLYINSTTLWCAPASPEDMRPFSYFKSGKGKEVFGNNFDFHRRLWERADFSNGFFFMGIFNFFSFVMDIEFDLL